MPRARTPDWPDGWAWRIAFFFSAPAMMSPGILVAADLLVHPAVRRTRAPFCWKPWPPDCPVVVTGVCGYAPYVEQAQAGWVLPEPFDQDAFNRTVRTALERRDLGEIGRRGVEFAQREDLYGMVDAAVGVIEAVARNDNRRT